jgi:PPM family protein phosphatase
MTASFERPTYAQRCEIGLKRQQNEDAFGAHLPSDDNRERALGALFVVADGVGSIGGGEQASHWAVKTLVDTYFDAELEDEDVRERLVAAIQDAQDAVRARARILKVDTLGTTVAGVILLPSGRALIFNVGDSRVYLLHGSALEQVTTDQVYVDPKGDPKRAKLTSYLGQPQPILPNIYERQLARGDKLLVCSDGLWGLVEKDEIGKVIATQDAKRAVDTLVEQVYALGARDNVTICVVETGKKRGVSPWLWLALLVIAGVLAAVMYVQLTWNCCAPPPPTATTTATLEATAPPPASTLVVRTPTPGG